MASVYPLTQAVPIDGAPAEPPRLLDRFRFAEACVGDQCRTVLSSVRRA